MRHPYTPLKKASYRDLTLKTLFLLVLTSAMRVGELHGLAADMCHLEDWCSLAFSCVPDFMPKTRNHDIALGAFECLPLFSYEKSHLKMS